MENSMILILLQCLQTNGTLNEKYVHNIFRISMTGR